MTQHASPFKASHSSIISEYDFVKWLAAFDRAGEGTSQDMASDISDLDRTLRFGEAAALLKAVSALEPIQVDVHEPVVTFLVTGVRPTEELLLSSAIAAGLGLSPVVRLVPDLRTTDSSLKEMSSVYDVLRCIQPELHNNSAVTSWFQMDNPLTLRNHLLVAIGTFIHLDPVWDVIATLLCAPISRAERTVCVDVKVGDPLGEPKGQSYMRALEFAKSLVKVGWLANLRCFTILTDARLTIPSAFGVHAVIEDCLQALEGRRRTPPVAVAEALSAQAFAYVTSTPFSEAEVHAKKALSDGRARAAVQAWEVFNFNALRSFSSATRWRTVISPSSGYFEGVESRHMASIGVHVAGAAQRSTTPEDPSVLVLPHISQHIQVGEELLLTSGIPQDVVGELAAMCKLADHRPQEWNPIRATVMLEAVLVRRTVVVLVPVVRDEHDAISRICIKDSGEPDGVELIAEAYSSVSQNSGTTIERGQQLARQVFGDALQVHLTSVGSARSDAFAYQPRADMILSLKYVILLAEIDQNFQSDARPLGRQANRLKWVSATELAAAAATGGQVIRTCWPMLQNAL